MKNQIRVQIPNPREPDKEWGVGTISADRLELSGLERWSRTNEIGKKNEPGLTLDEFEELVLAVRRAFRIYRAAAKEQEEIDA